MAKTGRFYHEVVSTADVSVTTTFAGGNKTDINLLDCNPALPGAVAGAPFNGKLEGLVIRVKSIAVGASKLTIKITHAASGAEVIIPDTEANVALEVGSTTEGGVAFSFNFPYVHTDDQLHIFYKGDGNMTVDALELYWSE
tara:strand:+ start:77 stop:499 length:423 start_codon:yes stop_codon:yes gene_type:complete